MPVTLNSPFVLTDPGYVLWAPLLSTEPTNTVVGSVFTDTWPVAWLNMGASMDGSQFTYSTKVSPIMAAEFLDPIRWATVERSGSLAFATMDYTANNIKRAYNGGTLATVSGAGTTLLSSYIPVTPGNEIRAMLGWESLDRTMRIIMYQCLNGGDIKTDFKKVPAVATLPCNFNFEVPAGGPAPFKFYYAGASRVGV